MYSYLREAWKRPKESYLNELMRRRAITWRKQPVILRVEKPTRLEEARKLGYKDKKGFVVVRVRIRRGGRRKPRPTSGRRQKRMGVSKYTPAKSRKLMAEERSNRVYPNTEVLGSYQVWSDGQNKWFEVILVDLNQSAIKGDHDLKWMSGARS